MIDIIRRLDTILATPSNPEDYDQWLTQTQVLDFLQSNAKEDEIVIYAGLRPFFLQGVLVPRAVLDPTNIDDLLKWDFNPYDSWNISGNETGNASITHVFTYHRGNSYTHAEQLVFIRRFDGVPDMPAYVEIPQKLAHVFGIHHMTERNAWCRLDHRGDIEEVCRVVPIRSDKIHENGKIVLLKREVLAEYSALTQSILVRTFESTLTPGDHFNGWNNSAACQRKAYNDLCFDIHVEPGYASYVRGAQMIHLDEPTTQESAPEEYENYLAYDWKNRELKEISCSPTALADYYTESELPYRLTPAFFRPGVLSKFKGDREKYTLTERSIYCRGSWHLQTYDINAEGQVHTYLVYLGLLPHEEQLHWKQYNEEPKGPISKRAFKTDFEGDWSYTEDDPLAKLKAKLGGLRCSWWKLRSQEAMDWAHYPVTQTNDEWRNELLFMDQLLVEGFEEKWLKGFAAQLGRKPELIKGSLNLMQECLIGIGVEEEEAKSIVLPFRTLKNHRNKLRGHASENGARMLKAEAFRNHGGYREHYTNLVAECDEAMKSIIEKFSEHVDS